MNTQHVYMDESVTMFGADNRRGAAPTDRAVRQKAFFVEKNQNKKVLTKLQNHAYVNGHSLKFVGGSSDGTSDDSHDISLLRIQFEIYVRKEVL